MESGAARPGPQAERGVSLPHAVCPRCPEGSQPLSGREFCLVRFRGRSFYPGGVRDFRKDPNMTRMMEVLRHARSPACPYLVGAWEDGHGIDCGKERRCPPAWERAFTSEGRTRRTGGLERKRKGARGRPRAASSCGTRLAFWAFLRPFKEVLPYYWCQVSSSLPCYWPA